MHVQYIEFCRQYRCFPVALPAMHAGGRHAYARRREKKARELRGPLKAQPV